MKVNVRKFNVNLILLYLFIYLNLFNYIKLYYLIKIKIKN